MKGGSSLPLLVLAGSACSMGPPLESPTGLVTWPVGQYVLEASVPYNQATESSERRDIAEYVADLTIAPGGSMSLTSSSGLCRVPARAQVPRDERVASGRFECGDVTYSFRPAGGTIRGEITARIQETFRVPGPCRSGSTPDGTTICVPTWQLEYRMNSKTARLRVLEANDS